MINNKNEREQKKNEAISLRESGDLEQALDIFKEVEEWDQKNDNPTGQIDVLGHIRITYDRMGDQIEEIDEKKEMYLNAQNALEKALNTVKESDTERKAILQVHLASSKLSLASLKKESEERADLADALKIVTEAIEDLPGTVAHKAWPLNTKAKILFALDREEDAYEAVTLGERCIFEGYEDQKNISENLELEIKVWLSGLYLTAANYFASTNKNILAEFYANMILQITDPNNILGERKKEAKKILSSL